MKQIILFFAVQVLEENLVLIFSKYLEKTMNGILHGGKSDGENPKKYIRLWNTLFWISTYKKHVWNDNLSVSAEVTNWKFLKRMPYND